MLAALRQREYALIATSAIIARHRLLHELDNAMPRLLVLEAPAGSGKSTLARQFAGRFPSHAVCDCTDVESGAELGRRVLRALSEESPAESATLTQAQFVLGGEGSDRFAVVLRAWRRSALGAKAFVFDNVEHLQAPEARELLWKLLYAIPEGRCVVICTRTALPVALNRFASPHEISVVRADALNFDPSEISETFAGTATDAALLGKVAEISRGWPIAVLLLARFAREGRLRDIMEQLPTVHLDMLHEYLVAQVLAPLPQRARSELIACALIPDATTDDVAFAIPSRREARVNRDVHGLPFVERTESGTISVHPLVQAAIVAEHGAQRNAMIERVARAWEERGNHLRAAALHVARGDHHAAAAALDKMEIWEQPVVSVESAELVASLEREVIFNYPRLWCGSALRQRYSMESATLLREAEIVWERRGPGSRAAQWAPTLVILTNLLSEHGNHAKALEYIVRFEREAGLPDACCEAWYGSILHVHACVLARMGNIEDAIALYDRAAPLIRGEQDSYGTLCVTRATHVERVLANRDAERALLAEAIATLSPATFAPLVARAVAQAAIGAWLAGDFDALTAHLSDLAERVERDGVRAFAFLVAAASGHAHARPAGVESPYWLAYGYLFAAANARNVIEMRGYAQSAVVQADVYGEPFTRILARLTLAQAAPEQHEVLSIEIIRIGENSTPRAQATLAKPMRSQPSVSWEPVQLDVLLRTARRAGQSFSIQESGLHVLLALAIHRRGVSSEKLLDLLWPDSDTRTARSRLYVTMHRLRRQIGMRDLIVSMRADYKLNESLDLDLWTLEDLWLTLGPGEVGNHQDEALLEKTARHLEVYLEQYNARPFPEWFDPTHRRLEDLAHTVKANLARRALDRGDYSETLRRARSLIAIDELDEVAWELLVRAHIASGDRAEGQRQYRMYRDILKRELQAQPGALLSQLAASST